MALESSQAVANVAPERLESSGGNFRAAADKSAPTVLVVDDESLIRWSVAETLREYGFRVTEARDGASAVRAFLDAADAADAVVLDPHLPDSDDCRVLIAIRALSPTTPVILMTAHGWPDLHDEARALGAFTVLDKPFELTALPALVHRALTARSS
jgi:DNA-binding NtrC family response regulator